MYLLFLIALCNIVMVIILSFRYIKVRKLEALYKKTINYYGIYHQKKKCCEELRELKHEILVDMMSGNNNKLIKYELADVYNMLNQLMIINNINDSEIEKIMVYKMKRQNERIEEEITWKRLFNLLK